jgi:enamine deaminase RidA (YjgF/YER057c/UK114 family)
MSTLGHPRPEGLLHNPGFSQVVVASGTRTIYTAGRVSIDERGVLVGAGDLAAQTAQAMRNVGLALAAGGATYADIVKITTYVVNYKPEHRAVIGGARAPFSQVGRRARAPSLRSRCRSGSSRSRPWPLLTRPHVRLSTGRPVSQYAGNEGCAGRPVQSLMHRRRAAPCSGGHVV